MLFGNCKCSFIWTTFTLPPSLSWLKGCFFWFKCAVALDATVNEWSDSVKRSFTTWIFFFFWSPARLVSDGRQQIDWSCRSCWSNHISNPQWHVYTQALRNIAHQHAGAAAPVHRAMKRKIRTFGRRKRNPYRLMRMAAMSAVCYIESDHCCSDRYRNRQRFFLVGKRWFISPNNE